MELYRHQVVRDLAWCIQSAPLLAALDSNTAIWPASHAENIQWLTELDNTPAPLLDLLDQQKSSRLGLYYENLWRFYWQEHPEWQLLAHNLQVTDESRTLGAFDFLLAQDGAFWHVETAVKFYLGAPQPNQAVSRWDQWIGPSCNDRLDRKLARLQQHQLLLSNQTEGAAALQKLIGKNAHWQRTLCLQGYLFYPAHAAMAPPTEVNDHHGRGHWWYLSDFLRELSCREASQRWLNLPRHNWLSPAVTDDINLLLTGATLADELSHWVRQNNRPQLIAAMAKINGMWRETQRGFVVPDHWPWTT